MDKRAIFPCFFYISVSPKNCYSIVPIHEIPNELFCLINNYDI